jgi:glyoxylase-like metal-dependent hydrolase (beta-lactamase superfamily II)
VTNLSCGAEDPAVCRYRRTLHAGNRGVARDRRAFGAVVSEGAALLLDLGASPRHLREFCSALASLVDATPSVAVLTQWHWDHVLGIAEAGVPVLAHSRTATEVRRLA